MHRRRLERNWRRDKRGQKGNPSGLFQSRIIRQCPACPNNLHTLIHINGKLPPGQLNSVGAVSRGFSEDGKQDDRSLRLLDDRNYHHYDLEMAPADKPDAPAISLGRNGAI